MSVSVGVVVVCYHHRSKGILLSLHFYFAARVFLRIRIRLNLESEILSRIHTFKDQNNARSIPYAL